MTNPRPILHRTGLNQTKAALLIGIDARTMRRYVGQPGNATTREMPEPCRRLLMLIADVPGAVEYLEEISKTENRHAPAVR